MLWRTIPPSLHHCDWLFPLLALKTSSGTGSTYKSTWGRVDSKGLYGRWRLRVIGFRSEFFVFDFVWLFVPFFVWFFVRFFCFLNETCGRHQFFGTRLHSLCILKGGGWAEDFRGVLKFLEQKKGGYENCLNISWADAYFFVRFCLAFVIVLQSEKRNDRQGL